MKALDDLSMEKVKVKKVTTPEYDMLLNEVNELREKDNKYEIDSLQKDELIGEMVHSIEKLEHDLEILKKKESST